MARKGLLLLQALIVGQRLGCVLPQNSHRLRARSYRQGALRPAHGHGHMRAAKFEGCCIAARRGAQHTKAQTNFNRTIVHYDKKKKMGAWRTGGYIAIYAIYARTTCVYTATSVRSQCNDMVRTRCALHSITH